MDGADPFAIAARITRFAVAVTAAALLGGPAVAANDRGALGLYPAADFRLTDGRCTDCAAPPAALWYFEQETIAVPRAGLPVAKYATGVRPFDDIRTWAAQRPAAAALDYPPLVWVESTEAIHSATLAPDTKSLRAGDATLPLRLVDRIPLNRSYFDVTSSAWFATRPVSLRGANAPDGAFVARTLWPEDFRLRELPAPRMLPTDTAPAQVLRDWMREEPRGGAQSPFATWTAWQKPGLRPDLAGRTVLGFMVNGAQGDDDEAHGGHFALVTGRVAEDGSIGDWLVNNFYTLDAESEKGIIAAPLPLDNYLGDLNSGQSWYRPTYMLVAVLSDVRAAALVQSALGRVYNQFYRHQLVYYHPTGNCASISVDTLRAVGWDVPARGPTSRALAWASFPLIAAKERSIVKAKLGFDYLYTDQTRLMPAAALEEIFAHLLTMARDGGANGHAGGPLAQMLAQDLDALVFVRFPQFPSSRAFGDAPAVTTWEYKARVPSDPADAQIVPVPPRPFPARLRDPDLLPLERHPSDIAGLVWAAVLAALVIGVALWRMRRGGSA